MLAQWLGMRRGKVYVQVPPAKKRKQMELALENAEQELELLEKRNRRQPNPWSSWPKCWAWMTRPAASKPTISPTWRHGTVACGAQSGRFARSAYRKIKIRDAQGATTMVRWLRPWSAACAMQKKGTPVFAPSARPGC